MVQLDTIPTLSTNIGVNTRMVGGHDPPYFGVGSQGGVRREAMDGSLNIVIAYFIQKVCWKWSFQKKKGKCAQNVVVVVVIVAAAL